MRNINLKKEREIIKEECKYLGDVLMPELKETYKLSITKTYSELNTNNIIKDVFSKNKTIRKNHKLNYWIENNKVYYDFKAWKLWGNNLIDFFVGVSCIRLCKNNINFQINSIPIPYKNIINSLKYLIYKYPKTFMNEVIILPYYLVEIDIQSSIDVLLQSNYFKNNSELSSEDTEYLNNNFWGILDNAFLHFACALADNHFFKISNILFKDLYHPNNNRMYYTYFIPYWLKEILEYKMIILDYLENNNNNNIHISERKNLDVELNKKLILINGNCK